MNISELDRTAIAPNFDYEQFDLPENTSLTFRLQAHGSAADLPEESALREELKSQDAVIVEGLTKDDDSHELTKIAKGDTKTYQKYKEDQVAFTGWHRRMAGALFATRVKVVSIDIRSSSPVVGRIMSSQQRYLQAARMAQTEKQALELKPLLNNYNEALRQRDQLTLQNLVPRLGKLALPKKVDGTALDILAFYGPTHQSLVDALAHKQTLDAKHGFSVHTHADSDLDSPIDALYAHHVRGIDVPDELFLHAHALRLITTGLSIGGYVDMESNSMTVKNLDNLGTSILADMSYMEAHNTYKALVTRQYKLGAHSAPTN